MLSLLLATALVMQLGAAAATAQTLPDPGVSEALARERVSALRDLRYALEFTVPAARREPVRGRVTVRFSQPSRRRVVLDFAQPRDRVLAVRAGQRDVPFEVHNGHIVIPANVTGAGANELTVEFVAGDEALNRSDDFLYTLFVPARAHLAFPCFDQPDLKARYTLSLTVPDGWAAIGNGAERGAVPLPGADRSSGGASGSAAAKTITHQFAETEPLSTYLFAFAAGRFSVETATRNGRVFRMFHRETDAAKVARNRDAIVDLHASALAWLEDYTAIPYPWGKFDLVLIPSFQFSGMEHAGAIFYDDADLLLDESATQNQRLERASTIAHETAHMWFGDLVTMRWFNDVWTKEVFANFMAAKIVNPSFPDVNHDLRFLLAHYPGAYQVDRTAGANPIRQPLANLNEAGQMYGPIIYQKAPVVMRQLELTVGEAAFRDGLREYLKRHAFGNATWPDLIRILDARTPRDLAAWSRAWVEERGRPTISTQLAVDARGRIRTLTLRTADPLQRGLVWPQRLRVALGYPGTVRELDVDARNAVTTVTAAAGLERPLYVLPNGAGLGYGLFVLDPESRDYLLAHVEDIPDVLTRGSAWLTLWDNVLERQIEPAAFLAAALRALPRETDEQNAQRVLGYVTRTFWRHLAPAERAAHQQTLEATLREGLARAATQSRKAAWFNAYRDTVLSADGVAWLTRVWRRDERVPGLTLAEPDEITIALELAVREAPGWQDILEAQHARTQNPDRKARFAFVTPALSADAATREAAFARFREVANRRREPWVLESLQYLNHPLRESHAQRFVRPALDLLREIQQTGDIFFPSRWIEAILWGHRSPGVAATVRTFLAEHPAYPQRLRWTILSAADELFRVTR